MTYSLFRLVPTLSAFIVLMCAATSTNAAQMSISTDTVTYGDSTVTRTAGPGAVDTNGATISTLPYLADPSAFWGGNLSLGWIDLKPTLFDIEFLMLIEAQGTDVATSTGELYILVDEPVDYSFGGSITFLDDAGTSDVEYLVRLSNADTSQVLLESQQVSVDVASADLILGEQNGNDANSFLGSMTGQLLPGNVYRLEWNTNLLRNFVAAADSGALDGSFTMAINPSPVPEPGTGILLGLGLAGLGYRRRSA